MEVILLERIAGLGGLGDRVDVKPGYARNYLVPQGKAMSATERNTARFGERRAELERQAADEVVRAQRRSEDLAALELVITRRAGGEGRLFGSVGIIDIAEATTEAGVEVRRNEVRMPDGPIRQTGRYEVSIRVHPDVEAAVRVAVVPMGGSIEDLDPPADDVDEFAEAGAAVDSAEAEGSGAGEAAAGLGDDEFDPAAGEEGEEAAE
jgi:large subunit ribosomal protein L9